MEEIQAFSGPGTLARYLRTVSQCAKLKEKIEEAKQSVRVTSHNGRVQSVSVNGYDYVLEYPNDTEKKPTAIVGMGSRIDLDAIRKGSSASKTEKAATRARVDIFRAVNSLCGINAKLSSNYLFNAIEQTSLAELAVEEAQLIPAILLSDSDIPPEYFDSQFWSDTLRMELNWDMYTSGLAYLRNNDWDFARKCSTPLELCLAKCDMVNDSFLGDCVAVGLIFGVAGYPLVGAVVTAACTTGVGINKYECKIDCMQPCIP